MDTEQIKTGDTITKNWVFSFLLTCCPKIHNVHKGQLQFGETRASQNSSKKLRGQPVVVCALLGPVIMHRQIPVVAENMHQKSTTIGATLKSSRLGTPGHDTVLSKLDLGSDFDSEGVLEILGVPFNPRKKCF